MSVRPSAPAATHISGPIQERFLGLFQKHTFFFCVLRKNISKNGKIFVHFFIFFRNAVFFFFRLWAMRTLQRIFS
jgi:hypothetical protein